MPLPAGRVEVNQGTLTIKNLIPADSGLYDCVATNIMGTKKARTNVAVQRPLGLYIHKLVALLNLHIYHLRYSLVTCKVQPSCKPWNNRGRGEMNPAFRPSLLLSQNTIWVTQIETLKII